MAWYKVYAGLGGGFGGARYDSTEEFETQEQAEQYAWELACQVYESYEGMYGLQSISEIMEEEGVDEGEAEEIWQEQRERWLDYRVRVAEGPDDADD